MRPPRDLPADPGQDPPGRARRASAPPSRRPPVAPHRDPARSSVLRERGRGGGGEGSESQPGVRHQLTRPMASRGGRTAEGEGGEERELQHHPGPRRRFVCGGGCTAGGFKGDGGGGTGRKPGDMALSSGVGPSSKTHTASKVEAEKPWVHPKSPWALDKQPKSPGARCPALASSSSVHLGQHCHEFLPVSSPADAPAAALASHLFVGCLQEFYELMNGARIAPGVGKWGQTQGKTFTPSKKTHPGSASTGAATGRDLHGPLF